MKKTILSAAITLGVLTSGASATVIDFNNGTVDLTNNFNVDIFQGDATTQIRLGYIAQNGFDGTDGAFVHFNSYTNANSMQFKTGPVFLNSFDISSQFSGGGLVSLMQQQLYVITLSNYMILI